MKVRLAELKAERERIETASLAVETPDVDVLMHPLLPKIYRRQVERLERVLEGSEQEEAREVVRAMIDRVVLTPRLEGRGLDATLYGDLVAILSVCAEISGNNKPSAAGAAEGQLSVVAGARNCLDLLLVG